MCSEQHKAIIFRSELLHDPMKFTRGQHLIPSSTQHHLGTPQRAKIPPFLLLLYLKNYQALYRTIFLILVA